MPAGFFAISVVDHGRSVSGAAWSVKGCCLINFSARLRSTPYITAAVWSTAMKDKTCIGLCGCSLSSEKYNTAARVKVGTNRHFLFVVNITCPYMPITTDGKAPDLSQLKVPIIKAMEKAVRQAKRTKPADGDRRVSQKSVILGSLDDAIAKASGNGLCRYSLRQLYYAVRPVLLDAFDAEPQYNTFSRIVGEHEAELGGPAQLSAGKRTLDELNV